MSAEDKIGKAIFPPGKKTGAEWFASWARSYSYMPKSFYRRNPDKGYAQGKIREALVEQWTAQVQVKKTSD